MVDKLPLQSIYAAMMASASSCSDLELAVKALIDERPVQFEDLVDGCYWQETLMSNEKAMENWKHLLTINLLNHFLSFPTKELARKVHLFERQPWNKSSQYFRALVALNHVLTKMPVPEVGAYLLESGAALIDLQEYCPWQALPYTPYHLEFGVFLCLLAYLTKREELKDTIIRLAKWQLNTLDSHYRPFPSLFVREQNGDFRHNLLLYYLFFRSASYLTQENEFESAAQALAVHLEQEGKDSSNAVHPLWILIEKLFTNEREEDFLTFPLPEHIYDPSTSLVGYRSSKQHAICTLHGGHTGLGCLKLDDVEIINYGPQYLPLGDCRGFGIEGNHLSDHGLRKSAIELRRQGFALKGCVRLVDQPTSSPFQIGQFRGIWLEMAQEFKQARFNLKTSFLGLDGWEGTVFSFFVKANRCLVNNQTAISPATLSRYEGEAQPVDLEGSQSSLRLTTPSFKGSMQVIPLGGKNSFWGANFLIAYLLHPQQRHYQWQIEPAAKAYV